MNFLPDFPICLAHGSKLNHKSIHNSTYRCSIDHSTISYSICNTVNPSFYCRNDGNIFLRFTPRPEKKFTLIKFAFFPSIFAGLFSPHLLIKRVLITHNSLHSVKIYIFFTRIRPHKLPPTWCSWRSRETRYVFHRNFKHYSSPGLKNYFYSLVFSYGTNNGKIHTTNKLCLINKNFCLTLVQTF